MQTISDMLASAAALEPERTAVVFGERRVSYAELDALVSRAAEGLQRRGLRPGDRVMTLMPNSLDIVVGHCAVIRARGAALPLNVMSQAHEIRHIGGDTGARFLVADPALWAERSAVAAELPALEAVVQVRDLLEGGHGAPPSEGAPPAHLDDVVSIIYTSGTTGRPKGATQTHRSILASVVAACARNKLSREDRLLCALPLFNNFALSVVMLSAFWCGATLVVVDRFEARKVLDAVARERCTYFAGTPTMYAYLLQAFDAARDDLSSLRVTNSGGAACAPALARSVEETFGVAHLDGYGQTEGCGFTTLNPAVGVRKPGSVGPPLANVWVRVVDEDDRDVPRGQVGEIVERGEPFSVHGYWKNPDANAVAYRGGWFHSGDLGYLDDDGYLYVVDRKQDLIITGGSNIYPAEVEDVLAAHPKVALCALVGVPDAVMGELPRAYVILKTGAQATEQELIDYVRATIAKYKAPRQVRFVDALPMGPTGKILKRQLRDRARQEP